ncbi:hypothetical protein B0H13DRAFT_2566015 [Mycena leptocephala]|nr:hypothetical protein B0H13DRAFT_2566015 [Mycena leptocephala]
MALHQYPLDKTFLIGAWLEALLYGCLLCVFGFGVYIQTSSNYGRNTHYGVLFIISILMFILATVHVAINCFRLVTGFADFADAPGGPVAYLAELQLWHHIAKDTVYATQSILGDAAAVYRCWILWSKDYRIVIFPCLLLIGEIVSGYMVCGLYSTFNPAVSDFDAPLTSWITAWYVIAVVENVITTGLMAFRLWRAEKESTRYRTSEGSFMPILRILVESAALFLFVEILILCLYSVNYDAEFIILELITPIVGITFGIITIRVKMRSQQMPQDGVLASIRKMM